MFLGQATLGQIQLAGLISSSLQPPCHNAQDLLKTPLSPIDTLIRYFLKALELLVSLVIPLLSSHSFSSFILIQSTTLQTPLLSISVAELVLSHGIVCPP